MIKYIYSNGCGCQNVSYNKWCESLFAMGPCPPKIKCQAGSEMKKIFLTVLAIKNPFRAD